MYNINNMQKDATDDEIKNTLYTICYVMMKIKK